MKTKYYFVSALLPFLFSSCFFMEIFGENTDVNIVPSPPLNMYLTLNPKKDEYNIGDIVNLELSGVIDFDAKDTYLFILSFSELKYSRKESFSEYELYNTEDEDYYIDDYQIIYRLNEEKCRNFDRLNDSEHKYKLLKQIPVRFLKVSDGDCYFRLYVNSGLKAEYYLKIVP